jgi:CheY-like chemotaxis protein
MPGRGKITVWAENVTLGSDSPVPLPPGPYARIFVRDDGPGIPEEHLAKIFDPFYTTKETGSGLGLATSFSIVQKHGGHIEVDSAAKGGTTFSIYIPATLKEVAPEESGDEASLPQDGRLLVMDDDIDVRLVARDFLENAGFEVVFAKEGSEAVKLYGEALDDDRPFHAVILDLTVRSGMGARETLEEIARMDPEVRAIVASGYSSDPVMAEPEKFGFVDSVPKPFNPEELRRVVGQAISGK